MDAMVSFLSSIRWQDVADIAINSYILFRLYILLRKTIVFRVVSGIALLWVFQRIAASLGLIVTSWVIQGIVTVAALIIIIVFRNEIRSVLQVKNLKGILWGFPQHTLQVPVDIIADAINDLSRRRCGALVVLPGHEDIQDLVQNGIPWKGIISKEMLTSIFWPDNPVHDGAAVVQGNQITQVGVILPLSKRKDFPSYFGTRHRAAAGLAESSDALSIVVSEETGQVRVASGASVSEVHGQKDLSQRLHLHLGTATISADSLAKKKTELSLAAVISFLLVTSVWFSFARGMETLITLDVPIEYINRNVNMEILDTSANTVTLHLTGSKMLVKSIRMERVNAKLNLGTATAGTNTFIISKENISLPPGVQLKKVEPSIVKVSLDIPVEKVLPIQVDWIGKLPEHRLLHYVDLSPGRVRLTGPSRILDDLSTVYTEKVHLETLQKEGRLTLNLALRHASLRPTSGQETRVTVSYRMKERDPE